MRHCFCAQPPQKYSTTTKVLGGLLIICNLDHIVKIPMQLPFVRGMLPRKNADELHKGSQAAIGLAMNMLANTVIFTVPTASRGFLKAVMLASIQSVRSTFSI